MRWQCVTYFSHYWTSWVSVDAIRGCGLVDISIHRTGLTWGLIIQVFSRRTSLFFCSFLHSQGFLSDLLKKANRDYDEKKLKEYTQTIVSRRLCLFLYSFENKKEHCVMPKGTVPLFFFSLLHHVSFLKLHSDIFFSLPTVCTVLEEPLCAFCFILINAAVNLLYLQLRMFDLNGDGKLGLSEMARWVCFHSVPSVAPQTSLSTASSLSHPCLSTGSCQFTRTSCWSLRSDFPPVNMTLNICASFRDWSRLKESRQHSSVSPDSLREDYWSSNHCQDIWDLTQMYFPAYVKSIRIWIILSDVSFKTMQRPLCASVFH